MYEPAIFSTEQVAYGDFYAWFKAKLVAAGWENITSNYTTDGDVWHSTGESGTRNYYFSTFNFNAGGGMATRQYLGYTPGSPGSAGTFMGDPSNGGQSVIYGGLAVPCQSSLNTPPPSGALLAVTYSINKERAIIAITLPEGFFTQTSGSTSGTYGKSNLWYIGAPELYSTSGEDDSQSQKGLIIYGGKYYTSQQVYTNPYMQIYKSAYQDTAIGQYNENTVYSLDNSPGFKTRNSTGSFMLLDLIAAGPYEGIFLRLTDIFLIPESSFLTNPGLYDGDLITDGEYTYKIILMQHGYYRVLPINGSTNIFAVRVE